VETIETSNNGTYGLRSQRSLRRGSGL